MKYLFSSKLEDRMEVWDTDNPQQANWIALLQKYGNPALFKLIPEKAQPVESMQEIHVVDFRTVKHHWDRQSQTWDDPQYVYIGRKNHTFNLPDSPWRNPHPAQTHTEAEHRRVIGLYNADLSGHVMLLKRLPELRGKTLVCWCDPLPCHGHLLAELAALPDDKIAELARG